MLPSQQIDDTVAIAATKSASCFPWERSTGWRKKSEERGSSSLEVSAWFCNCRRSLSLENGFVLLFVLMIYCPDSCSLVQCEVDIFSVYYILYKISIEKILSYSVLSSLLDSQINAFDIQFYIIKDSDAECSLVALILNPHNNLLSDVCIGFGFVEYIPSRACTLAISTLIMEI